MAVVDAGAAAVVAGAEAVVAAVKGAALVPDALVAKDDPADVQNKTGEDVDAAG